MQTKEYLSIFALVFLGLCLISGLYKKAYAKSAKDNNIVCGISVYIAVVLIGVSQMIFGVFMKAINCIHYSDWLGFFLEFIP